MPPVWAAVLQQEQLGAISRVELKIPENTVVKAVTPKTPRMVEIDFEQTLPDLGELHPIAPLQTIEATQNKLVLRFVRPVRVLSVLQLPNGSLRMDIDRTTDKPTVFSEDTSAAAKTIVIDPGHGGYDPGAVHNGVQEKDVTLSIALKLKAELEALGYTALLTRESDEFIALNDRVGFALAAKAAAFVSIHADSFGDKAVTGLSLYTRSNVPSHAQAAALALRENGDASATALGFIDDALSTQQRADSTKLASSILKSAQADSIDLVPDDPLRHAGFLVLRQPYIPAVLVETGFITNEKEAENLQSAGTQTKLARALAQGITQYTGYSH